MDIVFLDTETTSLNPETGEIWEFAGIKYEQTDDGDIGPEIERMQCFIEVDLSQADPFSLKIGKFYERYPHTKPSMFKPLVINALDFGPGVAGRYEAAAMIESFTRGCIIVGNTVSFDENRLDRLLRANGQCPSWYYHIIDIEPLIVGYARAKGVKFSIPYSSSELSEWLDVEEPSDAERHTAMGDAEWVVRQWKALFG